MSPEPDAAVPRNSLCPCGSGLRYKNCHGALAAQQAAGAAGPAGDPAAIAEPIRDGAVVVFCRRAVDWDQPNDADDLTQFNRTHALRKLLAEWRAQNPGLGFHEYRRFLHGLARRTWEATGAQVLLNPIAMDADVRISLATLRELRRAEWIIPIDDDDWLAPDIAAVLRAAPAGVAGAVWHSLPLHVGREHCVAEAARPYLSFAVRAAERVVLSCAYAIHRRAVARLPDGELADVLLNHGNASRFLLAGTAPIADLRTVGSVHLRHQATAGSGTFAVDRTLGAFAVPDGIAGAVPWAVPPMAEMRALHAARAAVATGAAPGAATAPAPAWPPD
jgi:hypothetical protein